MPKRQVSNTITASNGVPLSGVAVNIKLMPSGGFLIDTKTEIVRELNVTTNGAGQWLASLESNQNIHPDGTWYEILEKIPKSYGGNRTWIIGVDGVDGNIHDLLIAEIPSSTSTYVPTYPIVKTAWSNFTLENGATAPGGPPTYYPPQFRLFDDRCEVRGLAFLGDSNGTWLATTTVCTFPVGFRPPRILRFPVNGVMLGQTVSSALFVICGADGTIKPQLDIKNAHLFLDGINFSITP